MSGYQKWQWLIARLLPYIAVVMVCLVGAAVWLSLRTSGSSDAGEGGDKVTPSPPSPSVAVAQSDPPDVADEKRRIITVSRQCIKTYYLRNPELLAGSSDEVTERYLQSLSPFVTDEFLDDFASPPLVTEADYNFRDAGGVQRVSRVQFIGDGDPASGVETEVTIVVTVLGAKTNTFTQLVTLTLDETDEGWRVSSLIEE